MRKYVTMCALPCLFFFPLFFIFHRFFSNFSQLYVCQYLPLRSGCWSIYYVRMCLYIKKVAIIIRYELFVIPDVDECKSSEPVCGEHAVCTNTVGSFICTCEPEYTGDASITGGCHDIDECELLERPCGSHAICENASPGYNCICPQGYRAKPDPQIACEQVYSFRYYL